MSTRKLTGHKREDSQAAIRVAKLAALRAALDEGEASGPARDFSFAKFIASKKAKPVRRR
jgi:Arc/MetJ-type ribon-helix-helix transcriptional regulator